MQTYIDGPAQDHITQGQRIPILLRVVHSNKGFDCLDQLDDEPEPAEQIWVYRLAKPPTTAMVDWSDKKTGRRRGGCQQMGSYAILPDQPDDGVLRNTAKWRAWCAENQDRLMPDWAKGSTNVQAPESRRDGRV